ncbi:Pentatricopeptide repeat-containing protein [Dirofilaria immitis]
MVAPLSKQNEAIEFTTISEVSIKNLKLIGWFLIIGNLITLLPLLTMDSQFADAAMKYSFLTFMYTTSLICTIFALKDSNHIMLYPILVTTIAFVIISLLAWIFILFSKFYCSHSNNLYSLFIYNGTIFSQCQIHWDISPLLSVSLLLITFEKLFEFIIFRRLMKIFELQQCNNIHFCVTEINRAFGKNNDTDDEIIVYDRITKNYQNGHTDYVIYQFNDFIVETE